MEPFIIKECVYQEEITPKYIYTYTYVYATNYGWQKLKTTANRLEDINSRTIIVRDFKTMLSTLARSTRLKFNKEILVLKEEMEKNGLVNTYRIFHSQKGEYKFFSNAPGTSFSS